MEGKKPSPEEIVKKLLSAGQLVPLGVIDGIFVEGASKEDEVIFYHRLDAFSRPTQQEAHALLLRLKDFYTKLHHASPHFREFVADRQFRAELYVFSGQMDFTVATLDAHRVIWHVDLEE